MILVEDIFFGKTLSVRKQKLKEQNNYEKLKVKMLNMGEKFATFLAMNFKVCNY